MLKTALIVDDNRIIVDALCAIVNWRLYGYAPPVKAYDGEEALKVINAGPVHFLITDIKMPGIDGITLLGSAMKLRPRPKAVVLSAYDDFQYVKSAFKLGATEYILKTEISGEMVERILRDAAEEESVEPEAKTGGAAAIVMDDTVRNRTHLKDMVINGFLRGLHRPEEIRGLKRSYPFLRLENQRFAVMSLKLSYSQTLVKTVWTGDERLFAYAAANVLDEVLDSFRMGDAATVAAGELAVLFSYEPGVETAFIGRCGELFEAVRQGMRAALGIAVTAGLTVSDDGTPGIHQLYQRALDTCNRQLIYEPGKLRVYAEPASVARRPVFDARKTNGYVKYLKSALDSYDPAIIANCAGEIAADPDGVELSSLEDVTRLYQKYFLLLSNFADENDMYTRFDDNLFDRFVNGSVSDLNRMLTRALTQISASMVKHGDAVRRAIRYINENYYRDINLASAADILELNRQYLGRIFLRKTRMSFSACLNDVRIKKAKEIILNDNMRLYQVSELVGYGSFEHFSRVFKKIAGVGPKEFASGRGVGL